MTWLIQLIRQVLRRLTHSRVTYSSHDGGIKITGDVPRGWRH